jgi:hypothetical protein
MRIKAADVTTGDKVLRYGMWFHVEKIELLPAERGGQLFNLWLQPVSAGGACFLALFPEETITTDRAQAQEVEG